MVYDVIIIGSGPAGYSAAIYTSRAFLKTLIISGLQTGGQLTTTTEVENFPGFPKGIHGTQLMLDMKTQAERFGTEIVGGTVTSIKRQEKTKTFITTMDEKSYESKTVIVASGASAQYLGLPSEKKFAGKGVSACATCDGFFFRGKDVVVVGGGDTAMEEANFLTTFATRVTIIHRRDEFRASPIMIERARKNPKITFLVNTKILEIVGDTAVSGVKIQDNKTGKERVYPAQGVFLAIGHTPNTEFLKGILTLDAKGYVIIHGMQKPGDHHTVTTVPGIFAAGDCVDHEYRQAAVAAGMGVMAAMDVQKWLKK